MDDGPYSMVLRIVQESSRAAHCSAAAWAAAHAAATICSAASSMAAVPVGVVPSIHPRRTAMDRIHAIHRLLHLLLLHSLLEQRRLGHRVRADVAVAVAVAVAAVAVAAATATAAAVAVAVVQNVRVLGGSIRTLLPPPHSVEAMRC